jgi:hypothetical protein
VLYTGVKDGGETQMKTRVFLSAALFLTTLLGLVPSITAQQSSVAAGVHARLVVTVEARHGSTLPVINREDVMVYEGHDRDQVTDWIPLQGDHAALELFILIDDSLGPSVDIQLNDLKKFIAAQPSTTAIGIGYMRDGTVQVTQNPTTDHDAAIKNLRIPFGERGISPSPYLSVVDLIKRWPEQHVRREILMISDGVDGLNGGGPSNPYLDQAIDAAQRAGVIVYSIYSPGAGHFGHSFWRINWGQNFLSELSDETGGESYGLLMGAPVSFSPYLEDLNQRLTHQYLLTFVARPPKKAGERQIKLRTEVQNADFASADKVYTPAGM